MNQNKKLGWSADASLCGGYCTETPKDALRREARGCHQKRNLALRKSAIQIAQQLSTKEIANHVFSDRQLGEFLGGSAARRYGAVNRALRDGSLIRLKRGTYVLGQRYRSTPIHPFAIAQGLVAGSYVSFESALAYHGWIPEAVFVTASVSPGRKTMHFETSAFGTFSLSAVSTHGTDLRL